jgi:predicted nuclease of predicted toxin-antitoxin system
VSKLRFYFDESVPLAVSQQLATQGIDVVSAHSLGELGDSDSSHLSRASAMERVLCTADTDFLVLAKTVFNHHGVIYGSQSKVNIGQWVKDIRTLYAQFEAETLVSNVIFLPLR